MKAALSVAILLLSACGSGGSIVSNAAAPPDNVVGDGAGEGLAHPANAGARERELKAAVPTATDGMDWHATPKGVSFGPSDTVSTFAIACENDRVVVRRFDRAPQGARATMSFTGNGKAASLPAASVGDTTHLDSRWEASVVPSDTTQAVARVFDGPGPVEIALAGTTTLVTRASTLPGHALALCR